MIRNKKILYIITAGLFLFGSGCKKYLDVNKNLNAATALPLTVLLTETQRSLGNNMAMGGGLSGGLACYVHWHSVRGGADAYGLKGTNMNGVWSGFYGLMTDLNVIINQAPGEQRFVYAGIAKILKAYAYSVMVDIWGDIPFSEFDQFKAGILQPKFDDDATIYPQLFTLLDQGIADINNPAPNASIPGADDVIYGGSKTKWIKAANTIKLKLYTQVRRVQNVTAQVTTLLASPATLIAATNESFLLPYGTTIADDRHPGFGDYTASQKNTHVSPWLYEKMKGLNHGTSYPNIFAGNPDPRLPYYIYNQLAVVSPAVPANTTEYRDGPFVSIYFGSRGPNRDGSQQNAISLFGIYPVGGRYDDGLGSPAGTGQASGTGAAPYRFITYADRLYLEAELINTGVIAGDAKAVLAAAMAASFAQVDYVITAFVKPSQTVPLLMGTNGNTPTAAVTTYINNVLGVYDAGTTAKRLEIIMTQKWLSLVGSGVDAYTDYRRTGYPVLFDPRDPMMAPGGVVQPPLNGNPILNALGQTQPTVPVVLTVNYPESLPWSDTERELNANAPPQKNDPSTFKIFWKP